MSYTGNKAYITPVGGARTLIDYTPVHHFANEMDNFAQCLMNNKPTKTPGEEGLRDMRIIAAAYESARSKQTIKLA